MILVDGDAPTDLENYLVSMQDASPETLVILMIRAEQSRMAFDLIEKGLAYDSVVRPFVSPLELTQKIDRAASELYHVFESEQLREYVSGKSSSTSEATLNDTLVKIAASNDLSEPIQIFIDALSREWQNATVVYFKYLPSHASLPLALSAGQSIETYRGLGLDLRQSRPEQIVEFFRAPESSVILRKFVREVLQSEDVTAFTHMADGEALGLFVALKKAPHDVWGAPSRALSLRRIFELGFKKNLTLKEKHALDTTDSVTTAFNRRHFTKKIEDEVSRARRILMPLSLVTFDLDHFHKINERVGFQQADTVLKAVSAILKKTTRVNDVIGRTGPDEFSLLLPHTGQMGAAVKAERLRRLIESTKFPLLGDSAGQVTVSIGISEYPSLSSDGESLVRSADEAMMQARESRNKVCLAVAPPDFKMDFSPNEVRAEDSVRVKR